MDTGVKGVTKEKRVTQLRHFLWRDPCQTGRQTIECNVWHQQTQRKIWTLEILRLYLRLSAKMELVQFRYEKLCSNVSVLMTSGYFFNSKLWLTLVSSVTKLTTPGWLKLANDAFHLFVSALFQCMEYKLTNKLIKRTFYFNFISVSRADTVNTEVPPLPHVC